jgi:hypothetical protein
MHEEEGYGRIKSRKKCMNEIKKTRRRKKKKWGCE